MGNDCNTTCKMGDLLCDGGVQGTTCLHTTSERIEGQHESIEIAGMIPS